MHEKIFRKEYKGDENLSNFAFLTYISIEKISLSTELRMTKLKIKF